VTYPQPVVDDVLGLLAGGLSHAEISRRTGISRAAIRDWSRGRVPKRVSGSHGADRRATCSLIPIVPPAPYAYLLGLYLGDGCISTMPKDVFRLRIACCDRYPHLMDLCQEAIEAVMPANKVGRAHGIGCTDVGSSSKHWPCLFPQHGPGPKHKRRIVLTRWQDAIVRENTRDFIRGLVHSDGCRGINPITAPSGKRYFYPRYEFTNVSDDIRGLFCWACNLLHVEWRVMNSKTISINKRADVAFLDTIIGPKT